MTFQDRINARPWAMTAEEAWGMYLVAAERAQAYEDSLRAIRRQSRDSVTRQIATRALEQDPSPFEEEA